MRRDGPSCIPPFHEGEIIKHPSEVSGAVTGDYMALNIILVFLITIFIFVAFAVFLLVKFINKLRAAVEKSKITKNGVRSKCRSVININAVKCPYYTTDL